MKKLIVLLVALALVPSMASAGTILETWHGTGGLTIFVGGTTRNTQTGWATVSVADANPVGSLAPLVPGISYEAYCVDLLHWSSNSTVEAETKSFLGWNLGGGSPQAASWLMNTYLGKTGTDKSALQLAIWEVLYETSGTWAVAAGTNQGSVHFSANSFNATAQTYLNAAVAGGASTYAGDAVWIQTTNNAADTYYQDFATTGIVSVPEPGSIMLFGSGMIGLAAVVRRRVKK